MRAIQKSMKYEDGAPRRLRALFVTLCRRFGRTAELKAAEVGVERGVTSELLLRYMPGLHLTLIDIWKADVSGTTDCDQIKHDQNLCETLNRIAPHRERTDVIWDDSLRAVNRIEDDSLDFVFLDGDHGYEGAINDLVVWAPKVKSGGLITGDDYKGLNEKKGKWGVGKAVDEFAASEIWGPMTVRTLPMNFYFMEKP